MSTQLKLEDALTPGPTLLQMIIEGTTEPVLQCTYPGKPPLERGEKYLIGFDLYQLYDWQTLCQPILGSNPARFATVVKMFIRPLPIQAAK